MLYRFLKIDLPFCLASFTYLILGMQIFRTKSKNRFKPKSIFLFMDSEVVIFFVSYRFTHFRNADFQGKNWKMFYAESIWCNNRFFCVSILKYHFFFFYLAPLASSEICIFLGKNRIINLSRIGNVDPHCFK